MCTSKKGEKEREACLRSPIIRLLDPLARSHKLSQKSSPKARALQHRPPSDYSEPLAFLLSQTSGKIAGFLQCLLDRTINFAGGRSIASTSSGYNLQNTHSNLTDLPNWFWYIGDFSRIGYYRTHFHNFIKTCQGLPEKSYTIT